jgi:hypothetical protein
VAGPHVVAGFPLHTKHLARSCRTHLHVGVWQSLCVGLSSVLHLSNPVWVCTCDATAWFAHSQCLPSLSNAGASCVGACPHHAAGRLCAENVAVLFVTLCAAAARAGLVGVINTRWPITARGLLLPGYARESPGVVSTLVRGFGVGACCGRAGVPTCCAVQRCSCAASYAPI